MRKGPVRHHFVLFLVGLSSREDIGGHSRSGLAGIVGLAFVPVELFFKARLRIASPLKGTHWNLEFPAAKCADSERRSSAQPFDNPKTALDHVRLSLGGTTLSIYFVFRCRQRARRSFSSLSFT
jgi:hypothetical protein